MSSENNHASRTNYKFDPSDFTSSADKMFTGHDMQVYRYTIISLLSVIITASCLSLFVTGELAMESVALYMGLIYLNVFSLTLPFLGIIESQPWFAWYIMASSWISIALLALFMMYKLTGNLKRKQVTKFKSKMSASIKWVAVLTSSIAVAGYLIGWSAKFMAEVFMVITLNVFAFPIVFFSPLFEFSAPAWIIIAALWVFRIVQS